MVHPLIIISLLTIIKFGISTKINYKYIFIDYENNLYLIFRKIINLSDIRFNNNYLIINFVKPLDLKSRN